MRNLLKRAGMLMTAAALPAFPVLAQGNAHGTPQRSDQVPPGLMKAFLKGTPGIMRAIIATQGSNSRLQNLPASP